MGLRVEMPAFMQRGEKQMSTDDANTSRLVTKIRWVVESANARIKRWKYLDHVLPTNQIPFIGDYVRCICAISNKYLLPLSSSNNKEDDLLLGNKMRQLASQVNDLKTYIEVNNVERKTVIWQQVSESAIDNFPRLNEDQLRSLTCGVYQLKLSSSYIQEHLDGGSEIFVHKENQSLIRIKLQSRHVSSKKYLLWIQFNDHEVLGWYCKCRAGARVVGVCSHIASIIWYLGFARYEDTGSLGVKNWSAFLSDASNIPEPVDLSDTGSEASFTEE